MTIVAVGAIKLSPSARTVVANGREVNLTRKEFDLLRTLMENKGRVLTREQLLEQVWGVSFVGRDAHGGHAREDASPQAGRSGPRFRRSRRHRARRGLSLEEERLMSATNASRNGCEAEAAEVPVAAPEVEADKPGALEIGPRAQRRAGSRREDAPRILGQRLP